MANRNRIITTVPQCHLKIISAISNESGKTMSKIVAEAVKQRIDKLPQFERERLLKK